MSPAFGGKKEKNMSATSDSPDEETLPIQIKLIEKAIDATSEGITISDVSRPDNPIIYANAGFERLTGYLKEEVIGRNCRFLQGPRSDPETTQAIRQATDEGRTCTVELLNYQKDGTPFWNRLAITPILGSSGEVTHFVGIQSDITELKRTRDELASANGELEEFRHRITQQLEQARDAQKSLLPRELPRRDGFRIAAKYVPMEQIGGDFYDVLPLGHDACGLMVGDVTGHGIHAALLSFMSALSFKNAAPGRTSTQAVVELVNELLYGNMHDGNFVAMFYAIYDPSIRVLTYTQAGSPPALIVRPGTKQVISLETMRSPIGVLPTVRVAERTARLLPGDKVLLHTDAIIESMNPSGEMLGMAGLRSFLEQHADLSIEEMLDRAYSFGLAFSGHAKYDDDCTLVGLQIGA